MTLAPLRAAQQAAEAGGAIHRDFFKWLMRLLDQSNANTIPIGTLIDVKLSATDVATLFDATGLGLPSERFAGWAICNGNNDTDDWSDLYALCDNSGAGGTAGSHSSAHTHTVGSTTLTTAQIPGHTHPLNINSNSGKTALSWANSTVGTASSGTLGMRVTEFGEDLRPTGSTATPMAQAQLLGVSEQTGATGQGHTHTLSGASVADNRPASRKAVKLMRVA